MSAATVLIEICSVHGRVLARERITLTPDTHAFTIGRSAHADVTVDDPYVAATHASVEITPEGKLLVSDLGSINGIVIAGKRHRGARNLELANGDMLKLGHTRLRVRTAHETLAPEKPDQIEPASIVRNPAFIAIVGGLACVAQLAYNEWLGAPRDLAGEIVGTLIAAMLVASAWVALWALLSRITQWEWRTLTHAAILLGVAAVFIALDGLLQLAWFAFSLPQWNTRELIVGAIGVGCALFLHLGQASNTSPRGAALVACIVPALLAGTRLWGLERQQTRDVNSIVTSLRIYPPALRLRSAAPVEAFFRDTVELRTAADAKRAAMPEDDEAGEIKDDDT
jgi:hypothetical protein